MYCDLLLSPLLPGVLDLKRIRKNKSTDEETKETAIVKFLVQFKTMYAVSYQQKGSGI